MSSPYGHPNGQSIHTSNPHAVGNRVYGGSSGQSHATFGRVDHEGYADRSRRQAMTKLSQQQPAAHPSMVGELVSTHPYAVLARLKLAARRV